ncbi:MAG: copper chaperone PCu(A)C [Alphaproteobacteria bacterium]
MIRFLTILAVAGLFVVAPAHAEGPVLTVEGAYALATTSVQKNGAVFATFANPGIKHLSGRDLAIISAETPVAEKAELHDHIMDGDVMMMREVGTYYVPAEKSLKLEPTGKHIMLMGLKEPLKPGDTFPVTVGIGDGHRHGYGQITFEVKVLSPAEAP